MRIHATIHGQLADQTNYLLLRVSEIVEGARQVVFEERLALILEKGDDLRVIGSVCRRHAEIQAIAGGIQRYTLQAEGHSLVFRIGKRLRVDHLQGDGTIRDRSIGLQKLLYPPRILANGRYRARQAIAEEEAHRDRLIDSTDH